VNKTSVNQKMFLKLGKKFLGKKVFFFTKRLNCCQNFSDINKHFRQFAQSVITIKKRLRKKEKYF